MATQKVPVSRASFTWLNGDMPAEASRSKTLQPHLGIANVHCETLATPVLLRRVEVPPDLSYLQVFARIVYARCDESHGRHAAATRACRTTRVSQAEGNSGIAVGLDLQLLSQLRRSAMSTPSLNADEC